MRIGRIIQFRGCNPYWNLSLEHCYFENHASIDALLLLWRNDASVVIGRHQNPWLECDLDYMRFSKIALVRRDSGGGAVYHDLGNTNYSIVFNVKQDFKLSTGPQLIADFLQQMFNVKCFVGKRNDIRTMVDGEEMKISGTAFKISGRQAYCHGTLLVNSDIDVLRRSLIPSNLAKRINNSTSTPSVRSNVINLSTLVDISHDKIIQKSATYFEREEVEDVRVEEHGSLRNLYNRFASVDWIIKKTPPFYLDNELVDFSLDSNNPLCQGIISYKNEQELL